MEIGLLHTYSRFSFLSIVSFLILCCRSGYLKSVARNLRTLRNSKIDAQNRTLPASGASRLHIAIKFNKSVWGLKCLTFCGR
jgi:hypothetical protein